MSNKKYKYFCILFSIFYSLFSYCSTYAKDEFEIKHADSLEADKQAISINGNINVEYKDALIEATQGKIDSDINGEPYTASFTGKAKLKLKDRFLEADTITIIINDKKIIATGKVYSELKDKKQNPIIITSDYQELYWSGENAKAKGNITTKCEDLIISSEEANIIYKNKKPVQALFTGTKPQANLMQPTNSTYADEFAIDIKTHNVLAIGNVKSTIWPNTDKPKSDQEPISLSTENLYIDDSTGTITAKSVHKKVNFIFETTNGESLEAKLVRNDKTKKPEKIVFIGSADVVQEDKKLSSEEIVFNFSDKKLTSNTKTNVRPKTLIFKN